MITETTESRRRTMQAVKSRDTKPELLVRHLIYQAGYRYRLHRADLPGKPDLVFSSRRKAIFVHGCFWHGHNCQRGARMPKTNQAYWIKKIGGNRERDDKVQERLRAMGWGVLVIWEYQIKNHEALSRRIMAFLTERADACEDK